MGHYADPWLSTQSKNAASSIRTRRPMRRTTLLKPFVSAKKIRWRRPPMGGQGWCAFQLVTGISWPRDCVFMLIKSNRFVGDGTPSP